MARRDRPQHVGSELDDFEDELKEDADEHEIDPDVDEDENEPAPSPAHRPDSLPPLLTNYLLPPLSLDEMRTKIEDDYYAVLLKSFRRRLASADLEEEKPKSRRSRPPSGSHKKWLPGHGGERAPRQLIGGFRGMNPMSRRTP